jgi:hypothetical protein
MIESKPLEVKATWELANPADPVKRVRIEEDTRGRATITYDNVNGSTETHEKDSVNKAKRYVASHITWLGHNKWRLLRDES